MEIGYFMAGLPGEFRDARGSSATGFGKAVG